MKHVTDLIQQFVSGELDGPQKETVEAHLKSCPSCRLEAEEALRFWKNLGSVETSPAIDSVWPAVQARTLGKARADRDWFFGSGNLARGALALTAVAAGLSLGVLIPAQQEAPDMADDSETVSSWLSESSWLSQSSWLGGGDAPGIDELLLGVELQDEVDGS